MAIDTDLQAFWPLDSNANDSWGSHTGTATGIVFSGSYATFGGAGDYIEVPDSVQLNSTTGSASCWFKTSAPHGPGPGTGAVLVGKTDVTLSKNGWNLLMYNGELHAQIKDGASGSTSLSGGSGLNDSAWHHALLVFSSAGTSTLYLDGAQVATNAATATFTVSSQPMRMGESVDTNWGSYTGDLDEVVVWSRALSAVEVAAIHTAGRGSFATLLPGPATLQGMWGSMVHNAPPDAAALEGMWGALVHSTPTAEGVLEGMWGSLVHSVPAPTAIVPDIAGTVLLPATFDGSGSISPTYYNWSWVSVPGGSSIGNAPIPFPDNGASAPINMTGNLGLWHFETTGATTPDTSGGSRDLTVNGATQVAGKVGSYALEFDGVNDYLSYAVADVFPGTTNAVSLAFWQYGGVGLGNNSIIRANAGGSRVINIHMPYGGQIYFDCGDPYNRINKAAPTLSGVWNHWVFLKDVVAGEMKIYLNGVLWHSGTGHTSTLSAITQLYIGSESSGSLFYKGKIDEVAVWSRVLSASEISDIVALQSGTLAGVGATHTFTPDVVGTYTINLAISPTVNTNADAVITAAGGGGPPSQGEGLQGNVLQGGSLQGNI